MVNGDKNAFIGLTLTFPQIPFTFNTSLGKVKVDLHAKYESPKSNSLAIRVVMNI